MVRSENALRSGILVLSSVFISCFSHCLFGSLNSSHFHGYQALIDYIPVPAHLIDAVYEEFVKKKTVCDETGHFWWAPGEVDCKGERGKD